MRTPVFSATWPAGSSDNWRCNSPHLLLCHRAVKFLGGGPDFYGGLGTASFSGTVQITGGTGTGYLEILPSSILATQITGSCACQILQNRFGPANPVSGDGVQGKGPATEAPCPAQHCRARRRSRRLPDLPQEIFFLFPQRFHIQVTDRFDPVLVHFDGKRPHQP